MVGEARADQELVVDDPLFANRPVDMPMEVLLGKPPRMHRNVARSDKRLHPLEIPAATLKDAAYGVLRLPTVADKTFLISIGDRTVGGLSHRDQMVGPWQVPVADCAVTLADYQGFAGEAMSMGERTPLAAIDAPASGRMAVAEAITNLLAAPIELSRVKLSANWMAATGHPGEDAALYDTVKAVALELCPALGVAIPVGKDSLSMKTQWDGGQKLVVAPVSLVVTAFARVADARQALAEAKAGEDFLVLAVKYSDEPDTNRHGGDLGWSRPGMFVPEFEQTMAKMAVGEISAPFRSQFGWHILQVQELRDDQVRDLVGDRRAVCQAQTDDA